jgi:hypothetical protein
VAIPNVTLTFVDGGLGIVTPGPGGAQAKIGVSLSGTELAVQPIGNSTAAKSTLVGGPLCDATCQLCDVAGTAVYAVPCPIESAGSVTATFAHVGTGACVVSATCATHVPVVVTCTTAGTLGTAAFTFAVNGGAAGAPVTSVTGSTWVYRVPGTFLVLTFAAGTYVGASTYTCTTAGAITVGGGGIDTVTGAASPIDAYSVLLTITTAGARGTSQFTYSLDGGVNTSAAITTAATYVIPGAGIKLAFTDAAAVLGDTYTGTAVPPATNNTDIGAALTALIASSALFEGVHIVGTPSSSANAATLASAVEAKMVTAAAARKWLFALIEAPTGGADTDAVEAAAFASFTSVDGRTQVCAGDAYVTSTATGLILKRNNAWVTSARIAASKMSEDPGKVLLGPLPNVTSIVRDENATPLLHDARFITLRTIPGQTGYYVTGYPTMATTVSDYADGSNVRVINRAATIAYSAFAQYLNADVRIDSTTGYIDERDALDIDNNVTMKLQAALMGDRGTFTDECSTVVAQLSRTDNLLSNPTANATVYIVPKGKLKVIAVNIGFRNPRIA